MLILSNHLYYSTKGGKCKVEGCCPTAPPVEKKRGVNVKGNVGVPSMDGEC